MVNRSDVSFDAVDIIYNKFLNPISYEAHALTAFSEQAFKASPNSAAYEVEQDVLQNLQAFSLPIRFIGP
jgi:F-type H+-transporting ATPase subunit gamma